MKFPTQKEIEKFSRKNISEDKFIKMSEKIMPDMEVNKQKLSLMKEGEFLAIYKNKKDMWIRLHLKRIWIKKFKMGYSNHPNSKSGGELLISNFPLPKGPVL